MSFLIDPPWLYANGRAIAALADDEESARRLGAATMALFWGVSIPLYLDRRWTRPIWRACRAASGRDWMLNSGVFGFDHERPSRRTHLVSAAIFATYPAWLYLGYRRGRR
jgi:hypothetical protein